MADILLHQLEISPFCDKVRRVLAFKRLEYSVRNVPVAKLGSLKKLSRAGKVPILEIDGRVLHDSSDICRALDQLAPDPPLLPRDPVQRALVDILEDWADESLYFFEMTMRFTWLADRQRWVTEILKHDSGPMRRVLRPLIPYLTRKQGMQQGLARRSPDEILGELRRHLAALGALLHDRLFLVGDALSLGDIAVLAQIKCIAGSGRGREAIEREPSLHAWTERVEKLTGGAAIR